MAQPFDPESCVPAEIAEAWLRIAMDDLVREHAAMQGELRRAEETVDDAKEPQFARDGAATAAERRLRAWRRNIATAADRGVDPDSVQWMSEQADDAAGCVTAIRKKASDARRLPGRVETPQAADVPGDADPR